MGMFPIGRTKEAEAGGADVARVSGPTEHRVARQRTEGERRALADRVEGEASLAAQRQHVLEMALRLYVTWEPHLRVISPMDIVVNEEALRNLLEQTGKLASLVRDRDSL